MYDQSTLGTANNSVTFNNFAASPIFLVEQTMPTRREIREQDAPIPGEMGVADFDSEEGKSYFVISGEMFARTESEFYAGKRLLRKVGNLDIQQADPLTDNGYSLYQWTEAGSPRGLWVKAQYVDKMGEELGSGYSQTFSIICKVKYPVIINPTAVTSTIGLVVPTVVTSNSRFPFKYPIIYGRSSYSVGGSVTNAGDISAYPSFTIHGPVNIPRITNVTSGEYIEVNVNLATSSDILSIAYDQDTAPSITFNGTSAYDKKSSGSTFFKIRPGGNDLSLTGQSINGAYATVSFYSSWPLS